MGKTGASGGQGLCPCTPLKDQRSLRILILRPLHGRRKAKGSYQTIRNLSGKILFD